MTKLDELRAASKALAAACNAVDIADRDNTYEAWRAAWRAYNIARKYYAVAQAAHEKGARK